MWNPVKELKDQLVKLISPHRIYVWNPVKELKVRIIAKSI